MPGRHPRRGRPPTGGAERAVEQLFATAAQEALTWHRYVPDRDDWRCLLLGGRVGDAGEDDADADGLRASALTT